MNVAIGTIRGVQARDRARELARNLVWAVVDSGVARDHPHFSRHKNLTLPRGLSHLDFLSPNKGNASGALIDTFNHGTMIASVLAGEQDLSVVAPAKPKESTVRRKKVGGNGTAALKPPGVSHISGVAPSCRVMSVRTLDDSGNADEEVLLRALAAIQEINDFGRTPRVHGVVFALGGDFDSSAYPCGMSPLCVEIDRMVRMGICVVVPSGNEGFTNASGDGMSVATLGSISDPGNAELAITVGSTHREIPEIAGVSYFSSKGPTRDGRCKPDLVAPGERLLVANATGGYREVSGTTVSAAMVAGAAVALQAVFPELIGRPLELKRILLESATDLKRDRSFQGYGLLNVDAAFALAADRLQKDRRMVAVPKTTGSSTKATRSAEPTRNAPKKVTIMVSYAFEDLTLWQELEKHLAGLKNQGLIETWYDQQIDAGQEWEAHINARLETSDILLLMVSSYFLASPYCWNNEMKRAIERHHERTAVVIPIIVRPCDWETAPFAKLQAIPRKGNEPVTRFGDQHEAWSEITKQIRSVVEKLASRATV